MNKNYWVIDTETTGLSVSKGNRVVEVGMTHINKQGELSGLQYQHYFNPERDSEEGAFNCHKLTTEYLSNFPTNGLNNSQWGAIFSLLNKVDGIVIQNAKFDLEFLKNEYRIFTGIENQDELDKAWIPFESKTICTKLLADRLISVKSLDKILAHFNMGKGGRDTKHGALEDSYLTAQVFLKLKQLEGK